jgi:hypothetical protein
MHAARPNQVMRQLREQLPSQLQCSALIDLVQRMRPLHGPIPAAAGDAGDGNSSSSSSGWRSVLGVYLTRGYPYPALRLLERGVLLADVAEGTAAGELDAELYCRWTGNTLCSDLMCGVFSVLLVGEAGCWYLMMHIRCIQAAVLQHCM